LIYGGEDSQFLEEIAYPDEIGYFQYLNCLVASEPDADDPFCGALRQGGQHFIPVAAAGNLNPAIAASHTGAVEFPYAPALWDSVLSVSATDAQEYVAKTGEVAMQGNLEVELRSGTVKTIEGTSFAAPRLAVWAAIYLMQVAHGDTDPCDAPPDPILNYAETA
jgi:hypothetical protein